MPGPSQTTSDHPVQPAQFPCSSCDAALTFAPGLHVLKCAYCGTENPVPEVYQETAREALAELDFHTYLKNLAGNEETYTVSVVKCSSCGAESSFQPNIVAGECAFCGTALVNPPTSEHLIKPRALLPFRVDRQQAYEAFRKWINSLWFAPNDLKKRAVTEGKLSGMYLPHWTFDSHTNTDWTGQRGEHYYVTETHLVNGKPQTRQVRRTRWYHVSGRVDHTFDDVLVCASNALPRKLITSLEPWDLQALVPYEDAYLAGFRAERYSVELEEGWNHARNRIDRNIDQMIRRQIGGDEQRITWKNTHYNDITFKHILLPLWISAYRYQEKVYRFMINARTGEVQGERPWSWLKITLLVLLILAIVALFVLFTEGGG